MGLVDPMAQKGLVDPPQSVHRAPKKKDAGAVHGNRMQRSKFPSWWTMRSKLAVMSSCCLQIWLMSGRSTNFKDFDRQFGAEAVARSRASRSWTLSPKDSTFFRFASSHTVSEPKKRRIS